MGVILMDAVTAVNSCPLDCFTLVLPQLKVKGELWCSLRERNHGGSAAGFHADWRLICEIRSSRKLKSIKIKRNLILLLSITVFF